MSVIGSLEVVTGSLSAAQIMQEVTEISNLLILEGFDDLIVDCGWGCKLETDQLWRADEVKTIDLSAFVHTLINKGIYSPGNADLIIRDHDNQLTVKLCHESDIHLTAASESLLQKTITRWLRRGYGGFKRKSDQWLPLDEEAAH